MNAEGISEDARSGLEYYQWGFEVPSRPFPLSWDQRHTVKTIAALELPWGFELSGLWVFHTGRPYTYYPSSDGFTPLDSTLTFEPNNARMDDYNMLNLKLSFRYAFGEETERPWMRLSVYLDARNVLNTKNVRWVDSSGEPGGELGDLSAWDTPRRVRLGVRLEL
jgi:outer membrane receptor protein involved in Fe transport